MLINFIVLHLPAATEIRYQKQSSLLEKKTLELNNTKLTVQGKRQFSNDPIYQKKDFATAIMRIGGKAERTAGHYRQTQGTRARHQKSIRLTFLLYIS